MPVSRTNSDPIGQYNQGSAAVKKSPVGQYDMGGAAAHKAMAAAAKKAKQQQ